MGACACCCSATFISSRPWCKEAAAAEHLESRFGGPFFFNVSTLQDGAGTAFLELKHVFRQDDAELVSVLDRIREGEVGPEELELLNSRVRPIRTLAEGDAFVILTPTNAAANRINAGLSGSPSGSGICL